MKETKFKEKFEFEYQGFILYIFDIRKMECRLKGLPKLASHITYSETNEKFQLDKPSFFLNGKPVWMVIRNFPLSIDFEDMNLDSEISKLKFRLPTASEIEAKTKSLYAKMIFGKKMIDSTYFLISFLLCVLVGLVVHLIDRIMFSQKPSESITNATQTANMTIQLLRMGRWLLW